MAASVSTEARTEQLKALMKSGVSLGELAAAVSPPPPWQEDALKHAAFVGSFDETRFRDLVVPDFPQADFQACIGLPGIEHARPLPEQTYRLKEAVAAEHLETWLEQEGREAIRSFSGKVLGKLPQTADLIERLRFLTPVNPGEALALFDRLFDEADRKFDLARCHALVELLRELDNFEGGGRSVPLRLLSPELRERRDTLGRYVGARGRFVDEYSKSANFLDREELTDPSRVFLDQADQWLLTIYGRGGIGKSMFLRWLIARQAIPRPKCISVAKLDFDDINIGKLAQFPGLMFIHFAEQLNRQIPAAPFEEYLGRYGPYAVLLLPPARLPRGLNISALEDELQSEPKLDAVLAESFAANLSKPVVVILDTLEEGVLHFSDALRKTLACLRSAHAQSSHLKILLSGRYDLKERGYLEDGDPKPIALGPLKDEDARRLLCDIIGLTPSKVVEATIRKSQGNPFILSLIAGLIQSGEVKTVAEVNALKAEFAYLINRVILHIPDSQRAVRWVVRYGVVPRRLTREFLESVMRPHLERELTSVADVNHRDRLQQFSESFPRDSALDLDAVWQDLRQYADSCGWLRADAEHLRFQPEVVRPMRALLRVELVFQELHASAVTWYSDQAKQAEEKEDPDAWARATAEALYHSFSAGDPGAESRWQTALDADWSQHIERRSILLEAVTDLLDFVNLAEDTTDSIVFPVDPRLAAYALRELAKVRAGIGFGTVPPPKNPTEVAELLRLAARISPDAESAGERLVRMALAVATRQYDAALALGLKLEADGELASPAESYTKEVLLARTYAGSEDITAHDHYVRACRILDFQENARLSAVIWCECARMLRDLGDWMGATAAYAAARRATRDTGDLFVLSTDISELMMEGGAYEAALTGISAGEPERVRDLAARPHEAFRRARIRALCEIAHGRPDRAERIIKSTTPAPNMPLQEAQFLELRGELASAQYDARAAASLFEQACQRYSEARCESEANEARLKRLRVVKDQIGDWRLAREQLGSFNPQARSFARLAPLVAIEAAHLSWLSGDLALPFLDHEFAAIARQPEPEKHVNSYLSLLETVKPEGRRYPLLKIFAALPTDRKLPALTHDLATVVPPPENIDPDFFPKAFGLIDLLGFINRNEGREWLQAALSRGQPSLLPRLLEAVDRLEADLPPVETLRQCVLQAATHGFGFAAGVTYMRLALDRSKPQLAAEVSGMIAEVPEEMRGTQIEAARSLAITRLPDLGQRARRQERHRAADVLRRLGQDKTVAQIVSTFYRPTAQAGLPWSRAPRATVELQEVSLDWPLVSRRELVPYDVARRINAFPDESVEDLKRALAEWELTPKVGVKLTIDDAAAVAMVPWEWALADHDFCFRSSKRLAAPRSWVSRIFSKLPRRLRQFLSFSRPLRVMILKPPMLSQESTGRGFELQSERPLTDIYTTYGVRAIEPKGFEAADVKAAMEVHDPDVVHIQAAVVERSRSLQLDLPVRTAVPGAEYLAALFKDSSNPIVILDPLRPMEGSETVLQLLLRNRFAADLVATGRVRAVLGAGLLRPEDLQYATERLAHRLGSLPLLRELLELFRRDIGPDRISSNGAALFASDPDEMVP
jgi:hypothetical protein